MRTQPWISRAQPHCRSGPDHELPTPAGRKVNVVLVAALGRKDIVPDELPQGWNRPATAPRYTDEERVIGDQLPGVVPPFPIDLDRLRPEMESPGQLLPKARQLFICEQRKPPCSRRVRVPLERQKEVDLISIRRDVAILKIDTSLARSVRPFGQESQHALLGASPPQSDDVPRTSIGCALREAVCQIDQSLAEFGHIAAIQRRHEAVFAYGPRNCGSYQQPALIAVMGASML